MGVYLGTGDINFLGQLTDRDALLWPSQEYGYTTSGIYISKVFGGSIIGLPPIAHIDYFANEKYDIVTQ